MIRLYLSCAIFIVLLSGKARAVESLEESIQPFLSSYCLHCHGANVQKADRRFDQLQFEAVGLPDAEHFQEIVDQLNLGTMPPEGETRPPAEEVKRIVYILTNTLKKFRENSNAGSGEVVLRRLNRIEYRNTIRDLFALEMSDFDPTVTFPPDKATDGFDNVGEGLVTSDYLLQNYLDAARQIARKVIQPGPQPQKIYFNLAGSVEQGSQLPATDQGTNKDGRMDSGRLFVKFRQPIGLDEVNRSGVPADGEYAIRISALAVRRNSRYKDEDLRYDSSEPMRLSISIQSRELGPTTQRIVAEYDIPDDEPVQIEHRIWLEKGFTFAVHWANGPDGSFKRIMRKVLPKYNPDALMLARNPPEMYLGSGPELHVKTLSIEGPFYKAWPPIGFARYFPHPPEEPDIAYLEESLVRLASQAFRRPVKRAEVETYLRLAREHLVRHDNFWDAARYGVQALLTSPQFLYLVETETPDESAVMGDMPLSNHELANRLSYFLWSSMPDYELRKAADEGELTKPLVLQRHVERMLNDDKTVSFIHNFTGQWLDLRKLGTMPPDPESNKIYYSDNLEEAMRQETRLFFAHIMQQNRSVLEFIDADYTFANSALARHYGIQMETGLGFQKIVIPGDANRGGVLGQGSILTATSNGVETLPVSRGMWVLENLLGIHPNPPPPDIEPIEPDTRGVTSIREKMEKHRSTATCYECHRKIDPFGLALENYDHLGVWRDSYNKALPIDSAVELPDGSRLTGPTGIKQFILARPEQFTRCLTEKLLVYALGRRLSFNDRDDVEHIVHQVSQQQYGLRTLIHQIVSSKVFHSK